MLAFDVFLIIKQTMSNVVIYTTDYCPYCVRAKNLLTKKKIKFEEINLQKKPEKFKEMQKNSNGARSLPQIFINKKHVGDCDYIHELEANGKLDFLLK